MHKGFVSIFPAKKIKFPLDGRGIICYNTGVIYATVAQQVEQLTRNEQVVRSNRISSSRKSTAQSSAFFFKPRTLCATTAVRPTAVSISADQTTAPTGALSKRLPTAGIITNYTGHNQNTPLRLSERRGVLCFSG